MIQHTAIVPLDQAAARIHTAGPSACTLRPAKPPQCGLGVEPEAHHKYLVYMHVYAQLRSWSA